MKKKQIIVIIVCPLRPGGGAKGISGHFAKNLSVFLRFPYKFKICVYCTRIHITSYSEEEKYLCWMYLYIDSYSF